MDNENKKVKPPLFWIFCTLATVSIIATIICFIGIKNGFKIAYAPELDNNWIAIEAVASSISAILTAIAIFIAIKSNRDAQTAIKAAFEANKISEQQLAEMAKQTNQAKVDTLNANHASFNALLAAKEANDISKKQLEELIYQREQADRPYIVIGLESAKCSLIFSIINEGVQSAHNVMIRFNDDFIESSGSFYKFRLEAMNKASIHIAPKQKVLLPFAAFGDAIAKSTDDITIRYEYEGKHTSYQDSIVFNISDYHWVTNNTNKEPIEKIAQSFERFRFRDLQRELLQNYSTIASQQMSNEMEDSDNVQ